MTYKKSLITLAYAATALTATMAQAKWEYAEWGMNPGEVVAASGGKAQPRKDDADDRVFDLAPLASSIFSQDDYSYEASFMFEPQSKALKTVNITPVHASGDSAKMDPKACEAMIRAAEGRLGWQVPEPSMLELENANIPMLSWTWASPDDGGEVSIVYYLHRDAGISMCKMLYYAPGFSPE